MPQRPWVERAAPYSGWFSVLLLLILVIVMTWHLRECDTQGVEQDVRDLREYWEIDTRNMLVRIGTLEALNGIKDTNDSQGSDRRTDSGHSGLLEKEAVLFPGPGDGAETGESVE